MKSKTPAILFALAAFAFLAYLLFSGAGLPLRVASHFDGRGQPDGWMSRRDYVLLMGVIGVGVPVLMAGVFFATRFLPPRLINLPQRDYWLAPERRARTFDVLFRLGLWLGCLTLLFMCSVHYLVVQANSRTPVVLPTTIIVLSALYLLGMIIWMVIFFRYFSKPASTLAHQVS